MAPALTRLLALGVAVLLVSAACTTAPDKPTSPRYSFCGLARTINGFDLVDAHGLRCADALSFIERIERGDRGKWNCSRAMHATFELRCLAGLEEVRVLEQSPDRVRRSAGIVRLSNWSFRLHGNMLLAREDRHAWVSLGRAPWCVPSAGPHEVLVALQLRSITRHGGCFRRR